jgi:hypothetical protein
VTLAAAPQQRVAQLHAAQAVHGASPALRLSMQ